MSGQTPTEIKNEQQAPGGQAATAPGELPPSNSPSLRLNKQGENQGNDTSVSQGDAGGENNPTPTLPINGEGDGDKIPEWASDPARVVDIVRELRDENAKHRREKREAEDAQRKEQEKVLAEQGEFKKLYEQASSELEQLKSSAEAQQVAYQKYQETFQTMLEARMKGVPAHIKTLLKDKDALEAMAYLEANADKFKAPAAPNLDAGKRSEKKGGNVLSDDRVKELSSRFRIR